MRTLACVVGLVSLLTGSVVATETPDERVLRIIGAGHLDLLRHCVEASPQLRLVEVADYLRRAR